MSRDDEEMDPMEEQLGLLILATGALGMASFGVVDALKIFPSFGLAGFAALKSSLRNFWKTLEQAFGTEVESILHAQYVENEEALIRTLRQGVRIGLTEVNAGDVSRGLGGVDTNTLASAAGKKDRGENLTDEETNVLARYELAADARIDAAVSLARDRYKNAMRIWAIVVSFVIATTVAAALSWNTSENLFPAAIVIGIAAVPIAPVSKDLATAVQSAATALRQKLS